jgi:cysteinyl-tRNA synthetase
MAQGVCAHAGDGKDTTYARVWMHNGFLDFAGEKMSKSVGNVVRPHDLLETHPGEVLRWALLSGHYRQPLDWTDELIDRSRKSLDRLYGVLERARDVIHDPDDSVDESLLDDLNTPQAFARLFALADDLDRAIREGQDGTAAKTALMSLADLLGVLQSTPADWFAGAADDGLKTKVEALLQKRIDARAAKDFAAADAIRAELDGLGVVVMDGAAGATWRLK